MTSFVWTDPAPLKLRDPAGSGLGLVGYGSTYIQSAATKNFLFVNVLVVYHAVHLVTRAV